MITRRHGQLWNNSHRPEQVAADLDLTLKQLGTGYLDLWLIVSRRFELPCLYG